mmetsp:Transcript_43218/g.120182  ORF Transcript_43218/g.120182 Transcript_43218/m.120182 type:complete len:235 (-) Transcript_43218:43-747(-)
MVAVSFFSLAGAFKGGVALKAVGVSGTAFAPTAFAAEGGVPHGGHDGVDHVDGEAGGEDHHGGYAHEEHDAHGDEDHDDQEEDAEGDELAEEAEAAQGVAARGRQGRSNRSQAEVRELRHRDGAREGAPPTVEEILKVVAAASVLASATSRLVEGRSRALGMPWCASRSPGLDGLRAATAAVPLRAASTPRPQGHLGAAPPRLSGRGDDAAGPREQRPGSKVCSPAVERLRGAL